MSLSVFLGLLLAGSAADPAAAPCAPPESLPPITQRGPHAIGVRTETLAGLVTEIWYPAAGPSKEEPARYPLRDAIRGLERDKLAAVPAFESTSFRNAPPGEFGKLPVVLFLHGYGLSRAQSVPLAEHWASRGFIVVAPDLPNITLADVIEGKPKGDPEGAAKKALEALTGNGSALPEWLAPHVDPKRLALVGHSMGADFFPALVSNPSVQVVIALDEAGTPKSKRTFSSLVFSGTRDRVEKPERQKKGYASSPEPKRFISVKNAGHLGVTTVCAFGKPPGGALGVLRDSGVPLKGFLKGLSNDGCLAEDLAPQKVWEIASAATAGVLEETLLCQPSRADELSKLRARYPEIDDYRASP